MKETEQQPQIVEEKIEYEIDKKEVYSESSEQIEVQEDKPLGQYVVEEWQFTWRASVVGSLLGCLIGKSHMHTNPHRG